MAAIASVNTFAKGMVQDLDKSYVSKQNYLEAKNFRLSTSTGESTGALENIEGNYAMHTLVNSITPAGYSIIGAVNVRDTVVAFITNDTNSRIISFVVNTATESIGSVTTLYNDALNGSAGTLNFKIAYPIKAVAVYESPTVQKVYWTDGYNNVRYCNIASNLTTDGNVYSLGSNTYMSPDKFEFLPEFTPTKPTLKDIVVGDIYTGMVAYSYQLYRINGAITGISPISDIIHVVLDNDMSTNTLLYKGNGTSIPSGKGFVITVDNTNSLGYDRLRLIRIHYSTAGSVPSIIICNEIEVSPLGGTVDITDVGNTVGELTIDEFNISSTELFKCGDLSVKDGRLFVANITESKFDCDEWDSRAVRFRTVDDSAYIFDSTETQRVIDNTFSNWDNLTTGYTEKYDGINMFNDPDNDNNSNYGFKFQSDGATLGAEGPNIKIDFETEGFYVDNSNDNTTFHTNVNTSGSDLSYRGYASPWTGGKLSWQRDEVYRLFVVFGNDRGQTSSPKWICDLRMPSLHDEDFVNGSSNTASPSTIADAGFLNTAVTSHRLYPRVYFKSFPTNATWAQIHRVKRNRKDKYVVTQGLALPTEDVDGTFFMSQATATIPNTNNELIKLVSPEINILKNINYQPNDYIEYVADATPVTTTEWYGSTHKLTDFTRVPYTDDTRSTIIDACMVSPLLDEASTQVTILDEKSFKNFKTTGTDSKGCTGLLISYANTAWSAENSSFCIVNYKSNVYGSQYGGHTYEARTSNITIPCSDIITSDDIDTYVDIPYGDTFINFFDVSTLLFDLTKVDPLTTAIEAVYVPLESSVNCNLRHDTSSQHLTYNNGGAYLRQEIMGTHTSVWESDTMDTVYEQELDLYLYNNVYSQELDIKYGISEAMDVNTGTSYDCKIKSSNKKFNSEIRDSFTVFGVNDYIEVDTAYGPVNALNTVNNKLLFWQENAFGVLSVNERSIVQDNNSAAIVLGTGGILDRYDYISDTSGTDSKFSILKSPSGVYWFYPKDRSLYRFTSGIENVSKSKMLQSWFTNNYTSYPKLRCIYDLKYNQAIFTLLNTGLTSGKTIVFDENMDAFSAFYDFASKLYIPFNGGYMSVKRDVTNVDLLYYHNSLLSNRGSFYGTLYDSTVKVLCNDNYGHTKAFDNISFVSTATLNGIEIYNNTFNSIRCYNNYQNTDYCTLTYGTNLERDEREWTTYVPRNAVKTLYTAGSDIFSAANLDKKREFRERIRDKYMITDFTYTNASNRRFVVPYVIFKYRISPR